MYLKNIKKYYRKEPEWQEELGKFSRLIESRQLEGLLNEAQGNYPAGHGIDHVHNVIQIIDSLVDSKIHEKLSVIDVFNLLVAASIHDLGMIMMIPAGATGGEADTARNMHSHEDRIKHFAESRNLLDEYPDRKDYIIKLASAHAGDDIKTVEEKLTDYKKRLSGTAKKNKWSILVRLICIADYLDLGQKRLRFAAEHISWDHVQEQHRIKHKHLSTPDIANNIISVGLTTEAEDVVRDNRVTLEERLKILTIVQKVNYEIEKHIKNLNEAAESEWVLRPLNEDYFGKVFPLTYGIKLYSTIFEKAFKNQDGNEFQIDMLGHSLYSRFVEDKDQLNCSFFELLKDKKTQLRILLLDPETELQQSCEIYEAQIQENIESKKENQNPRFILPHYNSEFVIDTEDKGDILLSIDKIGSEWTAVGPYSSVKLKLTKRILYTSITRYDKYMIVTPYTMGLSSQSICIVYTAESPIFDAFQKEFDTIWEKKDETRLFISIAGENVQNNNPIEDIVSDDYQNNLASTFYYENWILSKCKDRIRSWFEEEDVFIAPYELEIQPTNSCDLSCTHCIGRHIEYNELKSCSLSVQDIDHIATLLDWNKEKFRIEKIRISGLNGDPLSGSAIEFTKAMINKNHDELHRDIVLFTNGLNIDQAIDEILKINSIHISIDAGSQKTFRDMKGSDEFEKIFDNICLLKERLRRDKKKIVIGIGFVVTQKNYTEVDTFLEKVNESGVDFVRFKRDISTPNSISWRSWTETKIQIKQYIQNKKDGIHDTYQKVGNIYITDLPRQHWNGNTRNCMSYKYCLTVGPDGSVYTCDHLTSKDYTSVAKLTDNDLVDKIKSNIRNGLHCSKLLNCSQCPPFNYRFNYFMNQLSSVYRKGQWDWMEEKIDSFCS